MGVPGGGGLTTASDGGDIVKTRPRLGYVTWSDVVAVLFRGVGSSPVVVASASVAVMVGLVVFWGVGSWVVVVASASVAVSLAVPLRWPVGFWLVEQSVMLGVSTVTVIVVCAPAAMLVARVQGEVVQVVVPSLIDTS